jgi:capsular polysaccharide biosynthesis protein
MLIKKIIDKLNGRIKANNKNKLHLMETFFDSEYYSTYNPDLKSLKTTSLKHYLKHGWKLGFNPHPLFDGNWYQKQYSIKINPLLHFIKHGDTGRFNPHSLFDCKYYLTSNPDVKNAGINPLYHYISYGSDELRNPHPFFDSNFYLQSVQDEIKSKLNLLTHFILQGSIQNINPNPFFDMSWYKKKYRLIQDNPLIHYITIGEKKGFAASRQFNASWYLNNNPDLVTAGVSPLEHYLKHGIKESRLGSNLSSSVKDLKEKLSYKHFADDYVFLPVTSFENYALKTKLSKPFFFDIKSQIRPIGIKKINYPKKNYVAQIKNALIIGGTRYIITEDNYILHDEEYHFRNAKDAWTKYSKTKRFKNSMMQIGFHISQPHWVEKGINLMHEYNSNYFHFIVETIPRMLMIEEVGIAKDIPYIFENNLHPNIKKLIDLINLNRRPIIFVSPNRLLHINEVIMPSDLSCIVDSYFNGPEKLQTSIDVRRVKQAVKIISSSADPKEKNSVNKIYIKRSGSNRKLINQDEIEHELIRHGFQVYDTSSMTIQQQIATFENADLIVTPTGAHVTNIIWSKSKTIVFVLASNHPSHQQYIWEILGKVSESKVSIIYGELMEADDHKYKLHDDFSVPVSSIKSIYKQKLLKEIQIKHQKLLTNIK